MEQLDFTCAAWRRTGGGAKPRPRRRLWGLLLLALVAALALQAWPGAAAPAAVVQGQLLEDLNFRVEYLLWKVVARARLTLTSLGAGRYRVELSGEPQGLMKTLAGAAPR